jgi:hypothetical protein
MKDKFGSLREWIMVCFEEVALIVKDPAIKMLAMAAGSSRLPVQVVCFEKQEAFARQKEGR